MALKPLSRITLVWAALVATTIASWAAGLSETAGVGVLLLMALKLRWVLLDFMELRHAPWHWRMAAEGWTAALTAVLMLLLHSRSA